MLSGSALIQADLDYQKADVAHKIQQYVATSEGHSAELDKAFVMAIEIGLSCVCSNNKKLLFPTLGVTNVHERDC